MTGTEPRTFLPLQHAFITVKEMEYQLSPEAEQFLASVVAGGQFVSKEAALEAAVAALREKSDLPLVPEEHVELVEAAIVSAQEGRLREFTPGDWWRLRQFARDIAAQGNSSGP